MTDLCASCKGKLDDGRSPYAAEREAIMDELPRPRWTQLYYTDRPVPASIHPAVIDLCAHLGECSWTLASLASAPALKAKDRT